tara:strand:- start:539 stop:1102 length:564 start_codon:yes stop_codon:yes gene_type:complete
MIAECLLFLVTIAPPDGGMSDDWMTTYKECNEIILAKEHIEMLVQHFDQDNLATAYKIMWCESRGEEDALRTAEGNDDSGLFQFIESTWNWVAQKHNLPRWDEWEILRYGQPYEGPTSKSSHGFEQTKVQFSPYYNILMASLLAEETYSNVRWTDWNSSKWCWGNDETFFKNVRKDFVWWQKSNRKY